MITKRLGHTFPGDPQIAIILFVNGKRIANKSAMLNIYFEDAAFMLKNMSSSIITTELFI